MLVLVNLLKIWAYLRPVEFNRDLFDSLIIYGWPFHLTFADFDDDYGRGG